MLQDQPLVVKLWDHDTFGNDDAIGQVMVDLNPLVKWDAPPKVGLGLGLERPRMGVASACARWPMCSF